MFDVIYTTIVVLTHKYGAFDKAFTLVIKEVLDLLGTLSELTEDYHLALLSMLRVAEESHQDLC